MAGATGQLGTMPKELYRMAAAIDIRMNDLQAHFPGLHILDVVSMEGNSVLHIAASRGNSALIQEVVNQHMHQQQAGDGNIRILQLLSATNTAGDTPLHCAARAGHRGSVKAIDTELQNTPYLITIRNNAGDNALHSAARHGHHQVVEILMATVPQLSHVLNNAGTSALYLAVISGSLASVDGILRGNAANPSQGATEGPNSQNALHAAVLQSHEMVDVVLTSRPDLTISTDMSNNSTPLHFAASDGSSTIVTRILRANQGNPAVIVAMRDNNGCSALHVAARNGHADVVCLLINTCPDIAEIRDYEGKTFLHAASEGDNPAGIFTISYSPMLEDLMNAQDNQGNTPLHLLVLNRNGADAVRKLLPVEKLQVNIINNEGHTAFDLVKSSDRFFSMVSLVVNLSVYGARFKPQRQDKVIKWENANLISWRQETCKNLALVSTLIATVAFTGLFNVPGSYGADGKANLDGKSQFAYFIVTDTVAVLFSVMATLVLIYGAVTTSGGSWWSFALSLQFVWASVLSLVIACIQAIQAVTKKRTMSRVQLIIFGIAMVIQLLPLFAFAPSSVESLVRFALRGIGRQSSVDKHVSRHFPLARFFVFHLLVFMTSNVIILSEMCIIPLMVIIAKHIKS